MTTPSSVPTWIDDFLFWNAALVAILVLADWLLGEEKRAAIREKMGYWWIYVQDLSYAGLTAEDARRVHTFLQRIFGAKWYKPRFTRLVFVISIVLTWIVVLPAMVTHLVAGNDVELGVSIIIFLVWSVTNAFLNWLSLAITFVLLRHMSKTIKLSRLALFILLDAVIAISLAYASYRLVVKIVIPSNADHFFQIVLLLVMASVEKVPLFVAASAVGAFPTLMHLGLAIVFLGSKLLRPVLQPPVSLVLLRFHESKKGVLTILAVFLGSSAKLVQEATKYFGGL